jgi:hypothetical protein
LEKPKPITEIPKPTKTATDHGLKNRNRRTLVKAVARVQITEYITEPVNSMKSDPFKYWSMMQNANKWKYLWPVVRKYLSAPCGLWISLK